MGVIGTSGSALGGVGGEQLLVQPLVQLELVVGAGVLLGGIMGGKSAKKQAEQQKKQLEAQYRAMSINSENGRFTISN